MRLPRENKKDNFQGYTNVEVRNVADFGKKYFNKPVLLFFLHPHIYYQWREYKKKVKNANYNYWIVCYALGI